MLTDCVLLLQPTRVPHHHFCAHHFLFLHLHPNVLHTLHTVLLSFSSDSCNAAWMVDNLVVVYCITSCIWSILGASNNPIFLRWIFSICDWLSCTIAPGPCSIDHVSRLLTWNLPVVLHVPTACPVKFTLGYSLCSGWCGEVRDVIYTNNGKVTVVYRVTVRGTDGEVPHHYLICESSLVLLSLVYPVL